MLNGVGAAIFLLILFVLALYLISTFSMAAAGDAAATKEQLGKLGGTCKGCHDDFKIKD